MPRIVFKVMSVDTCDRHLVQGYGYTAIPSIPGFYNESISTWKPELTTPMQLKSYFVGGCPELEDLAYPALIDVLLK